MVASLQTDLNRTLRFHAGLIVLTNLRLLHLEKKQWCSMATTCAKGCVLDWALAMPTGMKT